MKPRDAEVSDDVERACRRLCDDFAYHLDHGDFEALAELFAPDGVFVRNGRRLEGRDGILTAYAQRPTATTVHLVCQLHLIEAGAAEARGVSNALVAFAMGVSDGPLPFDPAGALRILEFQDRYVLTDQGWRFSFREPRSILQSPNWPSA